MKTLYLTNELRKKLKEPFGKPIFGEKQKIIRSFEKKIKQKKYKKVICVGDYCSLTLPCDIKIFDGKIKRNKKVCTFEYLLSFTSPPASINKEAWKILKRALKENENVFVNGEEDLLVIPSVILAEEGDLVVYGLPKKGVSLIEVTKKIKKDFRKLLRRFKKEKFKKAVFGGTFDRLHKGHRYFILMAKYYAKEAIVGLCSDKMVKGRKKDYKKIQSFKERKKNLENYLKKIRLGYQISKIDNIYGSAAKDETIEAILLTEETFGNGVKINKARKKRALPELIYIILPYLLDKKGKKISSSKIRSS